MGTLASVMFGAEEVDAETAEIVFLSETQYMKDLLNSMDVDGSLRGHIFQLPGGGFTE